MRYSPRTRDVEFNPICWRPLTEEAICQVPDKPGPIAQLPASKLIQAMEQVLAG
jgi:hypothetical protein